MKISPNTVHQMLVSYHKIPDDSYSLGEGIKLTQEQPLCKQHLSTQETTMTTRGLICSVLITQYQIVFPMFR